MIINSLLLVIFVLINIGLARYDAHKIKNHIRIRHAINSLVYVLLILVFYKWLTVYKILGLLLIRIPVFNTALNIFRGKPPHYLSKTTTSIIDNAMNKYIEKMGYWNYKVVLFILAVFLLYF